MAEEDSADTHEDLRKKFLHMQTRLRQEAKLLIKNETRRDNFLIATEPFLELPIALRYDEGLQEELFDASKSLSCNVNYLDVEEIVPLDDTGGDSDSDEDDDEKGLSD